MHKATISEDLLDFRAERKSKRKKSSTNPEDLRGFEGTSKRKTKPDRNTRYRERLRDAKKSKSNRLRCYPVWMLDSDVIKLLQDVKLEGVDVKSITPRELREHFDRHWSELAGRVIALAALLAIRK